VFFRGNEKGMSEEQEIWEGKRHGAGPFFVKSKEKKNVK